MRVPRAGSGLWPDLEEVLAHWVVEQREAGACLSRFEICHKASSISQELSLENLTASAGFVLSRNRLSL